MPFDLQDWGLCPYGDAQARQRELLAARMRNACGDTLVLVEHPPVFTIGKQGSTANILVSADQLTIPVVHVERGGDITYHGPGQLVAYPIFLLPPGRRDVKSFLRALEDAIVAACRAFGAPALTIEGLTGVWIANDDGPARRPHWHGEKKIASLGCAFKQWIGYHGLAVNIDNDLTPFSYIHLCGLRGKQAVSLKDCCAAPVTLAAFKPVFIRCMETMWNEFCRTHEC